MNESEVRKLFLIIENTYNNFDYDDDKVAVWQDLLREISFEQAQRNLRRFVTNPENKFPPHPGILAEKPAQQSEGNYIPNAEETRLMLKKQDVYLSSGSEIPESARERMRQFGKKSI